MKKALIVYGGWEGHHPKETGEWMAGLLSEEGFQVDFSDSVESFGDAKRLKAYDLLIPNWTMGTLSAEQGDELSAAIEAGTGLAGIHGGMGDAFRNNLRYQFITGGQAVGHPDNLTEYTVNIAKKGDPVVAGLSDFRMKSEQYYLHVDPAVEVLATSTFQTKSAPWINGTVMPVAWKRLFGRGRVFYCALGHTMEDLRMPEVTQIVKRGLYWAAR